MKLNKIELCPVKDAYVCDCRPDETDPNGNEKVLYQGQFKDCFDQALIQWDFGQIEKDAKIIKAEIYLFPVKLYGKKGGQMVYYPLTKPWNDNTVTFNTLPDFDSKLKVVSDWPTDKKWHIVDITEIVKKWHNNSIPNHGIYCHAEGTSATCVVKFVSSEGSPRKSIPKLVVEYK